MPAIMFNNHYIGWLMFSKPQETGNVHLEFGRNVHHNKFLIRRNNE